MQFHSVFIIHIELQQVIFFGLLDENEQLTEEILTPLFKESSKLLIGQSKMVKIANNDFIIANQEDIYACIHASDFNKDDEKKLLGLVADVGKAFKHKYQSDIDELYEKTLDINAVFGAFANDLAALLETFYKTSMDPKSGDDNFTFTSEREPDGPDVQEETETVTDRFPGGIIPPEQRDEVLFDEFQAISGVYNVEMTNGTVSKSKVYIYTGINLHFEIQIDFTSFPQRPEISMPDDWNFVLESSPIYNNWDDENPPRILDLVNEIETLIGEHSPPSPTVDQGGLLGGDGANNSKSSMMLADRLLTKNKTDQPAKKMVSLFQPPVDDTEDDFITPEPMPVSETTTMDVEGSTPLQQIINEKRLAEPRIETRDHENTNDEHAVTTKEDEEKPAKPTRAFKIKPKFHIDGNEYIKAPERATKEPPNKPIKKQENHGTKTPVAMPEIKSKDGDKKNSRGSFQIPSVDEIGEFKSEPSSRKPDLKP
ncbi:MAG: hypothetical protein ACTSU9_15285, partial [Promethearchaeota archaeon]